MIFKHFEVLDSTNTYAMGLLNNSNNILSLDENIIIADRQTAGRGRMNRAFYSPAETGLYMSAIYVPGANVKNTDSNDYFIKNPALITVGAAIAVCRAIKNIFNFETQIKWVNDIYFNDKKICGILAEGHFNFASQKIDAVVIGIGVNICTDDFPIELKKKAGSLFIEGEKIFDKLKFAEEICNQLYDILRNNNVKIIDEYKSRSNLIDCKVEVSPVINQNEKNYLAKVIDITDEAKLKVKLENGEIRELDSGEVSIIKS